MQNAKSRKPTWSAFGFRLVTAGLAYRFAMPSRSSVVTMSGPAVDALTLLSMWRILPSSPM
jgi:hypothetical protein